MLAIWCRMGTSVVWVTCVLVFKITFKHNIQRFFLSGYFPFAAPTVFVSTPFKKLGKLPAMRVSRLLNFIIAMRFSKNI